MVRIVEKVTKQSRKNRFHAKLSFKLRLILNSDLWSNMKFIEMTGKQLNEIIKDDELQITNLAGAGITDFSIVRINQHGDIEVRRPAKWDVIGELIYDILSCWP